MITTTTTISRPRRRSTVGLHGMLVSEARLMRRNPALVVWVALLPVVASIVLGALPVTRKPMDDLQGHSWFDLYQPILVMFSAILISVQILPDTLTRYRERGILKRLRTTPASPVALLTAQAVLTFVVEVVVMLAMVLIPAACGAPLPGNPVGFLIAFLFSAMCMLAIGLVLASTVHSNKIAGAVGTLLFFVLQFFAGLWLPRESMPQWLRAISDATPSGSAVGALTETSAGGWPALLHLGVLVAWTVVLSAVAIRMFRWE
ncbi:ABC transporter permease [Williamsia sterculiae]|uniref:Transport permease protein n=1 Tax=Williamsia sterculiae TaxID=1344003 RepID=A0A1N7HCU1_9NOCA|nr:ABC transporter permease [Williamsia sterculiae]SIS22697.1 ABC-2 type transport system permease protein [Williamsia sterculiae]